MSYRTEHFSQKEIDDDEKVHERFLKGVFHRVNILVSKENKKGRVPPVFREKYMIDPIHLFEKSFTRISLASLYRRYRAIYIQGLTEALAIAQKNDRKEDVLQKIRQKIIEAGTAEKKCRQRLKIGDK